MHSPRALLVTPTSPWSGSFGAQQRTALLYDALVELLPVDVLVLEERDEDNAAPGDRREIIGRLTWKQPPGTLYKYGVSRWINAWCESNIDWSRYALIVGREFTPITKIDWPAHVRAIVDCDDAFYRYVPAAETIAAKATALLRGWMRYLQTAHAIKRYDHVFLCAARDEPLFRCRSKSTLPNVVPTRASSQPASQNASPTALIVGSMWYPPNKQGVEWFLEHCWPAVAARCPDLLLRIIGPAPVE